MICFKINPVLASLSKMVPAMLLLLLWAAPVHLQAQDKPAANEETEEPAEEEEPSKIGSKMTLTVTQMPGDTVELQALLRAKIDKVWTTMPGKKVSFFAVGDEDETAIGEMTTNAKGIAALKFNASTTPLNAAGYHAFAARFGGDDELDESDGDANILKAKIELTPVKEDSSLTISLKVSAPSKDGDTPIAEADVVVYVKRMVGRLKVGEGTTDEDGNVEIEIPMDLAGDENGNLFITAYIEDFEEYGNIAATTVQPWGKPVSYKIEELPQALWSPHPPSWMVITFFVLMAAVWGHYGIVVYKLSQIKRAG